MEQNADEKSFGNRQTASSLAERHVRRSWPPVQGGTFTITNPGSSEALGNPHQSAASSFIGAITKRYVVINDAIYSPMAYLTLTFDHRLIDGPSPTISCPASKTSWNSGTSRYSDFGLPIDDTLRLPRPNAGEGLGVRGR